MLTRLRSAELKAEIADCMYIQSRTLVHAACGVPWRNVGSQSTYIWKNKPTFRHWLLDLGNVGHKQNVFDLHLDMIFSTSTAVFWNLILICGFAINTKFEYYIIFSTSIITLSTSMWTNIFHQLKFLSTTKRHNWLWLWMSPCNVWSETETVEHKYAWYRLCVDAAPGKGVLPYWYISYIQAIYITVLFCGVIHSFI